MTEVVRQGSSVLITNNKGLCESVLNGRFVDGSSLDVLVIVRDVIHRGAVLLTHPLCGNLRPYQQPFRSVLVEEHPGSLVDLESLSIIENAVAVYKSCEERMLLPCTLDDGKRADYAFIDAELMKESLERYGQLRRESPLEGSPEAALRPAPLLSCK